MNTGEKASGNLISGLLECFWEGKSGGQPVVHSKSAGGFAVSSLSDTKSDRLLGHVVSEPAGAPRKATPLQVAKAVLSAFIGIRKRAGHERDVVTITPLQVVVAGVIGAAIFVLSLVLLVRFVTS